MVEHHCVIMGARLGSGPLVGLFEARPLARHLLPLFRRAVRFCLRMPVPPFRERPEALGRLANVEVAA